LVLGALTPLSENVCSESTTFPTYFEPPLENPQGLTVAPQDFLATITKNMLDKVKWSEEGLLFMFQRRTSLRMMQKEFYGLPALYSFLDKTVPLMSPRTSKADSI
jgi:hypothetical protein